MSTKNMNEPLTSASMFGEQSVDEDNIALFTLIFEFLNLNHWFPNEIKYVDVE